MLLMISITPLQKFTLKAVESILSGSLDLKRYL